MTDPCREHAERLARLESDAANLSQLIAGDVRASLTEIKIGVASIQTRISQGDVRFQEHTDRIEAVESTIKAIKANRHDRLLFLIYPIAASIIISVGGVIAVHIFTKGTP